MGAGADVALIGAPDGRRSAGATGVDRGSRRAATAPAIMLGLHFTPGGVRIRKGRMRRFLGGTGPRRGTGFLLCVGFGGVARRQEPWRRGPNDKGALKLR